MRWNALHTRGWPTCSSSTQTFDRRGRTCERISGRPGPPRRCILILSPRCEPAQASGDSLLHAAASQDAADTIRLLLACGANPRLRNKAGNTPLHESAAAGAVQALAALLESAQDTVLLRNSSEQTALHLASSAGHEAAAALLLTRGAPLEALDGKARGRRRRGPSGPAAKPLSASPKPLVR